MLRDHLRSFWRGVVNNKLTTCINVGGLALGLAVFFALTFYVQREFSYDAQWEDADRIYAIAGRQESPNGNTAPMAGLSYYVLGTYLQGRYPDAFEAYARVFRNSGTVTLGEQDYPNIMMHYTEPGLLDLLQFETVAGSLEEVFADPHAIAISAKAAEQMFGQESPLDRTLTFSSQRAGSREHVIKAIYRIPEPSTLAYMDFMTLFDPLAPPVPVETLNIWNRGLTAAPLNVDNYFKLRPGISASQLEAELRAFMDENHYSESGESKTRFNLMPLRDVYLMPSPFNAGGGVERLRILAAVGVLVLLITGCNFVMLATLRSVDRMREVGIRKTMGSESGQLMRQYLLDVFLQMLVAALLAIALLELAMPWMQAQLDIELGLDLVTWRSMGQCLAMVLAFTLLSGVYPALLMSRGQPAALLRSDVGNVMASGNTLRRLLVGMQFTVVIGLMLASAVVLQQIDYTRNRDRGYSLEQVIGLRVGFQDLVGTTAAAVTEFKRVPGVAGAAVGSVSPGTFTVATPTRVTLEAFEGDRTEAGLQIGSVGNDYFNVMSVPILAGREFAAEVEGTMPATENEEDAPAVVNVLLNLSASRALGFATPDAAINSLLTAEHSGREGPPRSQSMRVVGVVADTQFTSVMLPPVAQLYRYAAENGFIAIRFEPQADQVEVTEQLRSVWQQLASNVPFMPLSPSMMEGNMLYQEELEARIVIGSTMLALVIALMGLYGLVEATVAKRVKEIGVRKVMGAGNTSIVSLLIWQFSKPIVVANVVAWPLGLWAISRWLQRFPYRLDTAAIVWSAVAASLAALLIAWLTIGLMAASAASTKPVSALRYE
jgi:putative ABC transport system permease protein